MAAKKGGLGRGLESLFSENATDSDGAVKLNINDIEPNRDQPRKDFDEQSISELADSIARHGLIQPIVVKPNANGRYSIIAGERRWRASRIAGLNEVPVIIKDADEQTLMELALIENLQREDLNAVEEALGYRSLIDGYGLTQEEVAKRMGKSRSAVTNALRLLALNSTELAAALLRVMRAPCFRVMTKTRALKCCLPQRTARLSVTLKEWRQPQKRRKLRLKSPQSRNRPFTVRLSFPLKTKCTERYI